MAEQYPQMDGLCDTACAYAARYGSLPNSAESLSMTLRQSWKSGWSRVPGRSCPQARSGRRTVGRWTCPLKNARAAAGAGISCYGMTAQQYMESATWMTFSAAWQMDAAERRWRSLRPWRLRRGRGRSRRKTKSCRVEAAAASLMELPESWKRLRLPAMTKNTRRFCWPLGSRRGVLLIVAGGGIYRWGYNGAIAEKGNL